MPNYIVVIIINGVLVYHPCDDAAEMNARLEEAQAAGHEAVFYRHGENF